MKVCISFERRTRREKWDRLRHKLSKQDAKKLRRIAERANNLTGQYDPYWPSQATGERRDIAYLAEALESRGA